VDHAHQIGQILPIDAYQNIRCRMSSSVCPNRSTSVAILLCTLNGARFLPLQLASIEQQDFANWRLFASDDGSDDDTCAILLEFQKKYGTGKVFIRKGPKQGFVANFLSLACDSEVEATYFAFSDQGDVWERGKLSRALDCLQRVSSATPAVYCSRTRLIDEVGRAIGFSPLFKKTPSFRNALVQSIAGGNTMVFNAKTRDLLISGGADVMVPAHDWWVYLSTSAAGGKVLYDCFPTVRYRVHPLNLIGSNHTLHSRVERLKMVRNNRFKIWSDLNIHALERIQHLMIDENQKTLARFRRAREQYLFRRREADRGQFPSINCPSPSIQVEVAAEGLFTEFSWAARLSLARPKRQRPA
jgi:glycosyltransferase involved in cell wall biosynthesis